MSPIMWTTFGYAQVNSYIFDLTTISTGNSVDATLRNSQSSSADESNQRRVKRHVAYTVSHLPALVIRRVK